LLAAALALLAGCSVLSPKPDLSHSYVLNAVTEKVSPAPPPDPTLSLGVFYTEVPAYLDRPQMIVRYPSNQPYIDEYHRWLEPLGAGFSRVLAQDIAQLSDSTHIAAFPLPPAFAHDFEAQVTVLQFDGVPGGDVTLHAQWRITGPGGKPGYFTHETTITRHAPAGPDPAAAYVNTLSLLVNDLAREMVRQMPEARAAQGALRQ
jgi:uncharacterized lipoprotein YmbA